MRLRHLLLPLVLIVLFSGCRVSPQLTAPAGVDKLETGALKAKHRGREAGAVYVESNAPGANAVLAFPRAADGSLGAPESYATGGAGTGGGLGNQGGVILSPDGKWLFAVNAGSNEISSFRVTPHGLKLAGKAGSGGTLPVSLTVHDRVLFVLNAGGDGNITGFRIRGSGDLEPIPGATRPLSGSMAMAAQIGFSPDGRHLVVTERATNLISVYDVGDKLNSVKLHQSKRRKNSKRHPGSVLEGPHPQPSSGMTPFGFEFDRHGTLIVSEAAGGADGASTVSSYHLGPMGGLQVVSASVPTQQTAACWVVLNRDQRFAYTTNTGSRSVTGFAVGAGGVLTRLQADGVTAETDGAAVDAAFDTHGRYLYVRSSDSASINTYAWRSDGGLDSLGVTSGLPAGANGLAAR